MWTRKNRELGTALGCGIIIVFGLFAYLDWKRIAVAGILTILGFGAVILDTRSHPQFKRPDHGKHKALSYPSSANHSFVTQFILQLLEPGSIFYGIMAEKDSRRIAYFAWSVHLVDQYRHSQLTRVRSQYQPRIYACTVLLRLRQRLPWPVDR